MMKKLALGIVFLTFVAALSGCGCAKHAVFVRSIEPLVNRLADEHAAYVDADPDPTLTPERKADLKSTGTRLKEAVKQAKKSLEE